MRRDHLTGEAVWMTRPRDSRNRNQSGEVGAYRAGCGASTWTKPQRSQIYAARLA